MSRENLLLSARGLTKAYGDLQVLKGVDVAITAQQVATIVGPSGAGKTTLLHLIGTLDTPDQGSISLGEQAYANLKGRALSQFRNRNLGFVFQFHNLLPEFTAQENVALPAMMAGDSQKSAMDKAKVWLDRLGLNHRLDHKPNGLSGGEQQRVAVARALVNEPKLVLADEPSGNLDSANAQMLHTLFFDLRDQYGQTFVIVTHNQELAGMADQVFQMQDGYLIH